VESTASVSVSALGKGGKRHLRRYSPQFLRAPPQLPCSPTKICFNKQRHAGSLNDMLWALIVCWDRRVTCILHLQISSRSGFFWSRCVTSANYSQHATPELHSDVVATSGSRHSKASWHIRPATDRSMKQDLVCVCL
jgi:hypothetical protein